MYCLVCFRERYQQNEWLNYVCHRQVCKYVCLERKRSSEIMWSWWSVSDEVDQRAGGMLSFLPWVQSLLDVLLVAVVFWGLQRTRYGQPTWYGLIYLKPASLSINFIPKLHEQKLMNTRIAFDRKPHTVIYFNWLVSLSATTYSS